MSIESLQDSHTYHSRDKESGIHLQRDITARPDTGKKKMDDPYFSIGKKTDTTDSTYISVTKQAGIYAGKEGYDIQVKNNTRLKGAVIDSQAEKEKNRITTGTLTWENIDNKAEYKTGGHGISYNTGAGIPLNALELFSNEGLTVKDKAGTTKTSAVSKEIITITDKENRKQDIEKLNRNIEDSLNKLKEIFDKTKVEERKRLLEELGIVGNRTIHEIASHNGWKDGSAEKVALHGMLGAITGAKSGGSALSGLIAGGANEYAIGYLEKSKGKDWINKHPDTVQNISAAFGGILSKMTGGSGHTSAYISQMGTKWNEYLTAEEIAEIMFADGRIEEYLKLKGQPVTEETIEALKSTFIELASANRDADAIIITGSAGAKAGIEMGVIYDLKNSNGSGTYISGGGNAGLSMMPLNITMAAIRIVPLDDKMREKLQEFDTRKDILSDLSIGGTLYVGVGGGVMIPVQSKYKDRVRVYVMGIGTPQVGGDAGIAQNLKDRADAMQSEIKDGSIIVD